METIKIGVVCIVAFLISSCSASKRITYWESGYTYPRTHDRIMVVSIVKDSILRRKMEEHFTGDLDSLGYKSVSALNRFGLNGLRKLSQEETYSALCENGIDAVITIVLIDASKEKTYAKRRFKDNPSLYYYKRIWNYLDLLSDSAYSIKDKQNHRLYWETVFFDLKTLEPLFVARTTSFPFHSAEMLAHEYGRMLVKNMVQHKILSKNLVSSSKSLKPF